MSRDKTIDVLAETESAIQLESRKHPITPTINPLDWIPGVGMLKVSLDLYSGNKCMGLNPDGQTNTHTKTYLTKWVSWQVASIPTAYALSEYFLF
jgi:hypothetical protein